jgi:hypothetical protein
MKRGIGAIKLLLERLHYLLVNPPSEEDRYEVTYLEVTYLMEYLMEDIIKYSRNRWFNFVSRALW